MRERIVDMAQRAGLALQPDARVADLSVGERQRVEILKALVRGARVLILDEPTAVLTPQESEALFATLARLVGKGMAIVFISHKLDEVLRVSDRVAVLRAGRLVAERATAGTGKAELAELMVGRRIERPVKAAKSEPFDRLEPPVLWMREVSVHKPGRGALHQIKLAVRAGEIVAIAGVSGNGQVTLAELLSGLREIDAGELRVLNNVLVARPRDWIAAGVARVPEDRHAEGVIGDLPVWENAVSERLHTPAFSRWGFVRRAAARAQALRLVERFDVRLQGIDVPARTLSGGNMQKLVLGRAMSVGEGRAGPFKGPALIVASQPTWGLDIGAVAFVHRCLLQAAAQGAAVLLICEDLDEIFALADRVAVMHEGRLTAARPVADWTLAEIGLAMAGASAHAAPPGRATHAA
jgi:simple sugar transport system ATP-binding protein